MLLILLDLMKMEELFSSSEDNEDNKDMQIH